jgi:hypothetical protein
LAFVATAIAGPTKISDNNIGDIVTVGVNANLKVNNQIDQNIVNVIVALLNQQAAVIPPNLIPRVPIAPPEVPIIPDA